MYYFTNYLTDEQLEAEESKGICPVCKKNQIKGRQTKYCSAECRIKFNAQLNKQRYYPTTREPIDRNCIKCGITFIGAGFYCSKECKKEAQYENNKNPVSRYRKGEKAKLKKKNRERQGGKNWFFGDPAWLGGAVVNSEISYLITCIPDQPYTQEDPDEIRKILEELPLPRYKNGKIARKTTGRKAARKGRKARAYKAINYERGRTGPIQNIDKKLFKLLKFDDGEREEPVVIDEKESTTDTSTKN